MVKFTSIAKYLFSLWENYYACLAFTNGIISTQTYECVGTVKQNKECMKNEILEYLKTDVRFRERSCKNKGIANLVMKKYGIEIPRDKRDDFIADILNADRNWRKCLEDFPELQGSDYNDKTRLEQEKQLVLGYMPGYNTDIKHGKN